MLMAVSCSTDAIVHLTAIAGRFSICISLERFNQISDATQMLEPCPAALRRVSGLQR